MNFDEIINKPSELIVSNYFELQRTAEQKYGKNTVVFIEIGSFFEIYQSDTIGKAKEISKILNILLTKKNKSIEDVSERNPNLCGIPSVSMDKHLEKLMSEEKWTILIVKQKGTPPNISRYVERIISPGTNIDYNNQDDYSFIASIYIEKNKKDIFYAGLSLIDLSLGKTLVFENFGTSDDKNIPLDEIEQILKIHSVKELVFTFENIEETEQKSIISNFNTKEISFTSRITKELKDVININFQNEIFEKSFNSKGFYSAIEDIGLERMPSASASLSILLDFILEHNKHIASNLNKPEIISSKKFMYLGNNPIEQLNIHSEQSVSVSKIINNGITAIGKRFISEQLLNPLFDRREIEKRITTSALFINFNKNKEIENNLKEIYDIERIWRKIDLETISPFELFNFITSLEKIIDINSIIYESFESISISKSDISNILIMIKRVNQVFDINLLQKFNMQNISQNFIKEGVNEELDYLIKSLKLFEQKIIDIAEDLELIIDNDYKKGVYKSIQEYKGSNVSISYTELEGFSFEITEKRQEGKKDKIKEYFSKYTEYKTKLLKSSTKFYTKEIFNISEKIISTQLKTINRCKKIFSEFTTSLKDFESAYKESITFISFIDFYLNNVKLFEKKNYCIPFILDNENNFYEAEELRHPIVETIEENGIFIPNNITLGNKSLSELNNEVLYNKNNEQLNGFLLYGINSSGKTILAKSVGISIILAQAGFFVPAKSLRFTLFDSIFTRINGNDNLQKGLSTFAIEMLELKNIFNRATSKSLILGDEISHGTETISGLSIVASTILSLEETNAFFILATHLHQLEDIKEIKELQTVTNVHLSIKYEESSDKLIYNRKLQSGSGSSIYGLEFAKSLKLPEKFISKAYKIRSEIAEDLSDKENLAKKKRSKYNNSVYLGSCSLCSKKAEETHHINEQHTADENGMISHFHKNHKHNLLPLCKECHEKVHTGKISISGFMKTSNGLELIFEENN